MTERKVIIFTALEIERRAVARAVNHVARASRPCSSPGNTGGTPVPQIEIIAVGIRAIRHSAWQSALDSARQNPGVRVIVAGLGGGLHPALRVGDVVVDAANESRLQDLPFRFGAIHTSADLVCTAQAKSRLYQSTGALAIDMETALIRRAADEYGLPIIGVRAISDSADAALDPTLLSLVDDLGRPRSGQIALALVRRPALALALHRLGRDTRLALRQLEIAVRQIIDRLDRDPVGVPLRRENSSA